METGLNTYSLFWVYKIKLFRINPLFAITDVACSIIANYIHVLLNFYYQNLCRSNVIYLQLLKILSRQIRVPTPATYP